jgi:hypothetical protein
MDNTPFYFFVPKATETFTAPVSLRLKKRSFEFLQGA